MDLLFNAIDQAEPVKQGADAMALVNELMNKGSWQRHLKKMKSRDTVNMTKESLNFSSIMFQKVE